MKDINIYINIYIYRERERERARERARESERERERERERKSERERERARQRARQRARDLLHDTEGRGDHGVRLAQRVVDREEAQLLPFARFLSASSPSSPHHHHHHPRYQKGTKLGRSRRFGGRSLRNWVTLLKAQLGSVKSTGGGVTALITQATAKPRLALTNPYRATNSPFPSISVCNGVSQIAPNLEPVMKKSRDPGEIWSLRRG